MLTPASASARNIRSATPVCLAMPRPTTEIFATSSSWLTPSAPSSVRPLLDGFQRVGQIVARHGEGNVGPAVGADVLHDHVDRDVRLARSCEKIAQARARPIGHAHDRDAGFVLDQRRAAHRLLGRLRLGDDHRARLVAEAAAHVDRHVEFLGELDRAVVHHAAPRLASSSISS